LSLEIGAYDWGTYDFIAPTTPTIAASVDALNAVYLSLTAASLAIGAISAIY